MEVLSKQCCWLVTVLLLSQAFRVDAFGDVQPEGKSKESGSELNNAHSHSFPHAFLLPNGITPPKGTYNLQLSPFVEQRTDSTDLDVGGHASFGLFDWGGIHLRSLGIRTTSQLKVIGMGSLYRATDGRSGLGVLAILGVPSGGKKTSAHHGVSYLGGISGRMYLLECLAADVILHYDFTAKHFIPEAGLVWQVVPRWFAILDTRVTVGAGQADVLPGVKYQLNQDLFVGAGFRQPIGPAVPFERQFHLQLELGNH